MTAQSLLEEIKGLPVADRRDILIALAESLPLTGILDTVKTMEARWDVKASGGAPPAITPPTSNVEVEVKEQTEFTLVVKEVNATSKIQVIKAVREFTSLDLKAAKTLLETLPATIKAKISREEAEKGRAAIEAAGGVTEIV